MTTVCILSTAHYTFDPRIFYRESKALADAGYDVTFVTHHPEDETQKGIRIRSLGSADTRTERWVDVWSAYRVATELNADVYHFHDPELVPVGILLKLTTDAKVVYDVHEDYDTVITRRDWIPDPVSVPLAKLFPFVQSAFSQPFDAIVPATDWIEDQFTERGHENVHLIRNFPRIGDITISDPPVEPRADLTMVYVGSFGGNHGLMRMIDLVEETRERGIDSELWVIGGFNKPSFEANVNDRLERSAHGDRVQLLGYVDYEDIFSYLSTADLGLALADKELYEYCVPNKVFEYLAASTPVMVTDTVGMRRYLPDDCGFRVDASNTSGQADIVERFTGNVEGLHKMGENGRDRVKSEYCWDQEKERLLDLYRGLTGGP
ncbi:glycosyltransferase family 4 protein [Halorussus aquaticus]|uniref:Glycosyltransferase family 4 protein n=1 Tax=Halorussus aquaticus TaxID=2953748 RepID=A0ABD5Q757_9EURY|nr:glycosyltransferase family 4 protein [Halorussus aquaticus]